MVDTNTPRVFPACGSGPLKVSRDGAEADAGLRVWSDGNALEAFLIYFPFIQGVVAGKLIARGVNSS